MLRKVFIQTSQNLWTLSPQMKRSSEQTIRALARKQRVIINPLLFIALYILALIFTRFWNVENTARFTRDESYDIVKLHQYWIEKKITLVGAIDYTGSLVYSSLTYYTMMPFAVIGNFEPVSPVYAFSVVGLIAVFFIYLITKQIERDCFSLDFSKDRNDKRKTASFDKTKVGLTMILALVWFPLVQASRWSWNPYFLPFSMAIAIYLFLKGVPAQTLLSPESYSFASKGRLYGVGALQNRIYLILSGLIFGAAFHYHYISFVSTVSFLFLYGLYDFIKKLKLRKTKEIATSLKLLAMTIADNSVAYVFAGFALMILPFVIFDLRHPPGLFFTGYLGNNLVSQGFGDKLTKVLTTAPQIIFKMGIFLSGNKLFSLILILLVSIISYLDFKKKNIVAFIFLAPVVFQILIISFLPAQETRYFLPALIFFLVWILVKRQVTSDRLAKSVIFLMIVGNIFVLPHTLLTESKPSPKVVGGVSNYIVAKIHSDDLKNINIAVLASPDPDPLGAVYRDVLLSKEIRVLPTNQFDLTDNLFIISTSDEETVRRDSANVINDFRSGKMSEYYELSDSDWVVYLFNK